MNNIEKQIINGVMYPKTTSKGQYTPSQAYLNKVKEFNNQKIKAKEKSEYAHIVENQLFIVYKDTINNMRKKTTCLYEKIHYLADNQIGEIFQQIKKVMNETGKKISEMITDLRKTLGYNFTPNRYKNGVIVPIEANIIQKAWNMIGKANFLQIENVLMFN